MESSEEMGTFVSVVDEGSFSAAARSSGLTPSAVSRAVARLEDRLGVRLLERSTRRLRLTDAGSAYLEHARRALESARAAEDAARAARGRVAGVVRVTLSPGIARHVLVPTLSELLDAHPELSIEMHTSEHFEDLFAEGRIDCAIRISPPLDTDLIARRVASNHRVVCASPEYLARRGRPEHPGELVEHACMSLAGATPFNRWAFADGEEELVHVAKGRVRATTVEGLHDAARAGLGLVRISRHAVGGSLASGALVEVLSEYAPSSSGDVFVVYPARAFLPMKTRVFIDHVARVFAPASQA